MNQLAEPVAPRAEIPKPDRRATLGASEAPAVLGVDPYRTPHDVYLVKTGQVPDFEGNAATKRGIVLEPALLDYFEREAGRTFQRQVRMVHPSGLLSATLDGYCDFEDEPFLVEAKSTGLVEEWGEEGTDQVPRKVLVQIHQQFACVRPTIRVCYVPVLLVGFRGAEARLYKVQRNDRLCEIVEAAGLEFMQRVKALIPPATPPSLEVIERIRREPSQRVTVHEDLVSRWLEAKAQRKAAEDVEETARRDLLAAMGDAEIGESSVGVVTYGETKTSKFNLSRFKTEQPDIAAQYVEQSTYRTLRFKAAK